MDEKEKKKKVDIGRKRRKDDEYGEEKKKEIKRKFKKENIGKGKEEKMRKRKWKKEGEKDNMKIEGLRKKIGGNGRKGR